METTVKTTAPGRFVASVLAAAALGLALPSPAPAASPWWPAEVERALGRAGANRAELVKALDAAPVGQRRGMTFLVANMPERDLRSLRADFLVENLKLAYQARAQ